jgi:hypothetical protein
MFGMLPTLVTCGTPELSEKPPHRRQFFLCKQYSITLKIQVLLFVHRIFRAVETALTALFFSQLPMASYDSWDKIPNCAFPSWPRRSLLKGVSEEPTSFLSDDDLILDHFYDDQPECSPVPNSQADGRECVSPMTKELPMGKVTKE